MLFLYDLDAIRQDLGLALKDHARSPLIVYLTLSDLLWMSIVLCCGNCRTGLQTCPALVTQCVALDKSTEIP